MTGELEPQANYEDSYDEPDLEQLRGQDLLYYQDVILEGIAQETLLEETDRGLMTYFYGSQALEQKVVSLKPSVENIRGTLYGVAVCQLQAPLTPGELAELKDYCAGQYADGWGEGFEQRPRATAYGDLYVHFWQSEGFFIETKQELTRSLQKQPRDER